MCTRRHVRRFGEFCILTVANVPLKGRFYKNELEQQRYRQKQTCSFFTIMSSNNQSAVRSKQAASLQPCGVGGMKCSCVKRRNMSCVKRKQVWLTNHTKVGRKSKKNRVKRECSPNQMLECKSSKREANDHTTAMIRTYSTRANCFVCLEMK